MSHECVTNNISNIISTHENRIKDINNKYTKIINEEYKKYFRRMTQIQNAYSECVRKLNDITDKIYNDINAEYIKTKNMIINLQSIKDLQAQYNTRLRELHTEFNVLSGNAFDEYTKKHSDINAQYNNEISEENLNNTIEKIYNSIPDTEYIYEMY